MSKAILLTASVCLVTAVAIGAFGAHGLKSHLSDEMMRVYKTGVEYHFYHALGLLLVGILLFSGSLYVLAISGVTWLGAITPFGGLSFIVGWILLFVAVWKKLPF